LWWVQAIASLFKGQTYFAPSQCFCIDEHDRLNILAMDDDTSTPDKAVTLLLGKDGAANTVFMNIGSAVIGPVNLAISDKLLDYTSLSKAERVNDARRQALAEE